MTAFTVLRPGMLTTVQDLGRWGYQDRGVPVAGPDGRVLPPARQPSRRERRAGGRAGSHAGRARSCAPAASRCARSRARCSNSSSTAAACRMRRGVSTSERGATLRFGRRLAGARATLAVRGGIDVPPVLGSRATSLISRMGPFGGRALVAGDVVPIGRVAPRSVQAQPAGSAAALFPKAARGCASFRARTRRVFASRCARAPVFRAVHRHDAVESHGVPARGPGTAVRRGS